MNDDLISRQALRQAMYHEAFEKDSDYQKWDSGCWIRYKLFERVVDAMPSAKPEIVRCKDCKYHEDGEPGRIYCGKVLDGWESEDFFCKRGERSEDNGCFNQPTSGN